MRCPTEPCTCYPRVYPAYTPNILEKVIHITMQNFMLYIGLLSAFYIADFKYSKYNIIAPIPCALFAFMLIFINVFIANKNYSFTWWRNTYVSSFFVTGLYMVLIAWLFKFLYDKYDIDNPKDGGRRDIDVIVTSFFIPLTFVVLEYILVLQLKQYWISKYYFFGYTNSVKDRALMEYLGKNTQNIDMEYHPVI